MRYHNPEMKVAFLNTVYAPNEIGGAERTVRTLAEALVKHGHEAVVISLAPTGEGRSSEVDGVRVHYVPLANFFWLHGKKQRPAWQRLAWHTLDAFNPLMALRVAQLLRAERPDVVQMSNLQGFSVSCWVAARALDVPVVQMLHDYYLGCSNAAMFRNGINCHKQCVACRVLSTPRRALSSTPHSVISLSRRTLERLEECSLFADVSRKEVLHGACNLRVVASTRHDKAPGDPIVVGYLGRLDQTKGVEVLLRAAALLPREKIKVLLGGTGSDSYVASLRAGFPGIEVEFLGFVSPATLFARVDALVVPSIWEEPLGRVIYEAYHHGVPAIVSRAGGMPEIVAEGESGFVFSPGDARQLAHLLSEQIARGWPGARLADNCLRKSQEFSIDGLYHRYLDVWTGAATSSAAGRA